MGWAQVITTLATALPTASHLQSDNHDGLSLTYLNTIIIHMKMEIKQYITHSCSRQLYTGTQIFNQLSNLSLSPHSNNHA